MLVSSLLLAGCTTTITNLTPTTQKRNPNGLYPFEVELDTREHCIKEESLKPYVLIGNQAYPMEPTPMLKNRWETVVPIAGNQEFVNYRYKFNYDVRSFGKPEPSSRMSPSYQVQVLDK